MVGASEEDKGKEIANHVIIGGITLSKMQRALQQRVSGDLMVLENVNDSDIITAIDDAFTSKTFSKCDFADKYIVYQKLKQKYEFSAAKNTLFEIPEIVDVANNSSLDFSDDDKENWHYWKKHEGFLENKYVKPANPEIGLDLIARLDRQSDAVIKNLKDPRCPYNNEPTKFDFNTRGLVIGHVQSGKTANFLSVISKAVSIGYRFVIILAGTKNDLRTQTQNRFDQELSGTDRYNLKKQRGTPFADWSSPEACAKIEEWSIDGVEDPPIANSVNFWKYKMITERLDFDDSNVQDFSNYFTDNNVIVVVVKKNAIKPLATGEDYEYRGILGKLSKWIRERSNQAFLPPTLIIDDEADQASVDSNAGIDIDMEDDGYSPTTISGCLQSIISDVYGDKLGSAAEKRQIAFVGYTATPFANVFMSAEHDALYPKDFILSLDPPENYFGMSKYYDSVSRDIYINNCKESKAVEEKELLHNAHLIDDIPERLVEAFHSFLFYCIVKDHREINQEKTMMVHTSMSINQQKIIYEKLAGGPLSNQEGYKGRLVNILLKNKTSSEEWQNIYTEWSSYSQESEVLRDRHNYDLDWPTYSEDELLEQVLMILGRIQFKLINGPNDSLNYTEENLDYVIAVGGNILSRGLTLEGLGITYYMRNSYNYDSLIQMARWFGYRDGYEDLIRVYSSSNISDAFEYLLSVEKELREEIRTYERGEKTPAEFAPMVKAHSRMRPSGRMGVAQRINSYSGQLIQTFLLDTTAESIKSNNRLAIDFSDLLNDRFQSNQGRGNLSFLDVDIQTVKSSFINLYKFGRSGTVGIYKEELIEYIDGRVANNDFNSIDVIFSGLQSAKSNSSSEMIASGEFEINPVQRTNRRKNENKQDGLAHFGAISDSADFNKKLNRPRLVIYFIDKANSTTGTDPKGRGFKIEPEFNPVVFAMGFPKYDDSEYWQQEIFNNSL